MSLRDALKRGGRGTASRLARAQQVDPVTVAQWAAGLKFPEPRRCPAIVEFFGGQIGVWHLRPYDWHEIWPAQRDAPGAPPAPSAQVQAEHA